MAATPYAGIKNKQAELIRKALQGSVFVGEPSAEALTVLTDVTVGPTQSQLLALPAGMDDLGYTTTDGAQFSRDVATSEVTSWGSAAATRTDITSDTSTLTVTAQETKALTIAMATGTDLTALKASADEASGEVQIQKPARPSARTWRVLSLAVDEGDAGEIYIARYLPRAKVSGFEPQAFGGGDDPITWGVTFTGEEDSDLGFSESWFFGGPGWKALLDKMGFTVA